MCMVMRGGRAGGSGRDVRWVCSDFLRDVCPAYIICVSVCDVYVTAL